MPVRSTYHFVRDKVESCEILLEYIPTEDMVADALTKALPRSKSEKLVGMMAFAQIDFLTGWNVRGFLDFLDIFALARIFLFLYYFFVVFANIFFDFSIYFLPFYKILHSGGVLKQR